MGSIPSAPLTLSTSYCTERKWRIWCSGVRGTNLSLNVAKTKELDYRKWERAELAPLMIQGNAVERVSSFKFLGINITNNLTWDLHTKGIVGKAQQRLFHLRRLRNLVWAPMYSVPSTGAQ